jgi:uncharacterized membrane protein
MDTDAARGVLSALLGGGAAVGICISSYFLMLQAGVLDPADRRLPAVCRMERGECARVIGHPDARLLGVPNAFLGLIYYTVLLIAAVGLLPPNAWTWLEVAASATVAAGAYLTYSLVRRVRIPCTLCFASHVLNLVILLMLLGRRL